MRTGPQLIAATKIFAHDSSGKSWWCIISTSLLFATALVGALSPIPMPFRVASSILEGLFFLRLFVIYHRQHHPAIFPMPRPAEWCRQPFGPYPLSGGTIWRPSHNHHHNHNSKLKG